MLCAMACAAALPVLAVAPALGASTAGGSSDGDSVDYYLVNQPWTAGVQTQLIAPSGARSCSWNDNAHGVYVGDDRSVISLSIGDSTDPCDGLYLTFGAPAASGRSLTEGHYRNAQPLPGTDPARPSMRVINDDGCSWTTPRGSFDIRELHRTDGQIDRLWIVFHEECPGEPLAPRQVGEVRIGLQEAPVRVAPSSVTWPDQTFVGVAGSRVQLDVRPATDQTRRFDAAVVVGPGREQFELVADECSDHWVGPEGCLVTVRFAPTAPGQHRAAVSVVTRNDVVRVPLEAQAIAEVTRWRIEAEADHPLASDFPAGTSVMTGSSATGWSYGQLSSRVLGLGHLDDRGNNPFDVAVQAPTEDVLTKGRAYTFTGTDPTADTAGLALFIGGRDCWPAEGQVSIEDLELTETGEVRGAHFSLTHQCPDLGADGTLTAEFLHRVRADTERPVPVPNVDLVRGPRGRVTAAWSAPTDGDAASTVVRWYPARARAARHPLAGLPARSTGETQAVLAGSTDGPVTVSVFTYDEAGNVSAPAIARLD